MDIILFELPLQKAAWCSSGTASSFFFVEESKDKGKSKTLYGQLAVRVAVDQLMAEDSPKLSSLERFHTFGWLLNDEQKKQVAAKTKDCLASVASSARSSKARAPIDTDDKKAKKAKVENDEIMALFT